MQNTGKRCVMLLVFIILRWSFNCESNVFRYNKILIDCVFGNSKFVVLSTLTIDLGFASVNSQCLGDNKLAIPSYPVNKYIILFPQYIIINTNQLSPSTETNYRIRPDFKCPEIVKYILIISLKRGHPSYKTRFQMPWDSKILINYPP
jgi:hypothetical protein